MTTQAMGQLSASAAQAAMFHISEPRGCSAMKCLDPIGCTSAARAPKTARGLESLTLLSQAAGLRARLGAADPLIPVQGVLMIGTVGWGTSKCTRKCRLVFGR